MEYRTFGETIILRLDPGEEICESILQVAEKEAVALAEITGLGAINDFTTGVFDTVDKVFLPNRFQGVYEITSLIGSLTRMDGRPYLHVHLSAGDAKGNVVGGHLSKATVSATAEIVIRRIDGKVGRRYSEKIGLNLFDFS